ncbi:hypothetical protein GCM10011586_14190 [Silvibacterium dinghuense]|nr:hypothetical protein GCM10011586_14190 [Silvibacterium dinghuense]
MAGKQEESDGAQVRRQQQDWKRKVRQGGNCGEQVGEDGKPGVGRDKGRVDTVQAMVQQAENARIVDARIIDVRMPAMDEQDRKREQENTDCGGATGAEHAGRE